MKRATFNISMPPAMRKFVEEAAAKGNYGTGSEYIRTLIRRDQRLNRELEQISPGRHTSYNERAPDFPFIRNSR